MKVKRDWPMLRYIVNQSKMYKSNFINYYENLHKNYKTAEENTEKSILEMKERIKQKASQGRTKYSTYLEINPSLCKPNVYDMNIPTFKLQQLTKFGMGGKSQAKIEIGRHQPTKTKRREDFFKALSTIYPRQRKV